MPLRITLRPLQQHVRYKISTSLTCPLPDCHHMDNALHILCGCQCPVMRNMLTERHKERKKDLRLPFGCVH
eukprot:1161822-Pelagomonas_calceolata.AAC.3